jgi:hypothetical protein
LTGISHRNDHGTLPNGGVLFCEKIVKITSFSSD